MWWPWKNSVQLKHKTSAALIIAVNKKEEEEGNENEKEGCYLKTLQHATEMKAIRKQEKTVQDKMNCSIDTISVHWGGSYQWKDDIKTNLSNCCLRHTDT